MQISGSIPFHAAQAYGISRPAAAPAPAAQPRVIGTIPHTTGPRSVDTVADVSPLRSVVRPRSLDALVAATVHRPISFDGAATPTSGDTLQLYTRAADKVDASVAVQVGRALDVTG